MLCESQTWTSDVEFTKAFFDEALRRRTPLQGSLDLTARCNLHCVHCYIASDGCRRLHDGRTELGTNRILGILDEIVDAGCLYFLITGGEPLLRPDFETVYRHARGKGLLVTVFTNGTLIEERHAGLFHDLPPWNVEVTMYGASEETYRRVTGGAGNFDRFRRGLDRLQERSGVDVRLKTVVLRENVADFGAMKEFARSRGLRFRFDGAMIPTLAGDKRPGESRIEPGRLVDMELADPDVSSAWRKLSSKSTPRSSAVRRRVYQCGAGRMMFHVDAWGGLHPCLSVRRPGYALGAGSGFRDGWERHLPSVISTTWDREVACVDCDMHLFCNYCPGVLESKNQGDVSPDDWFCRLGKARKAGIEVFGLKSSESG